MTSSISRNEQRSDYVIPSEGPSLNFVDKLLDHDEVYLHVKFKIIGVKIKFQGGVLQRTSRLS